MDIVTIVLFVLGLALLIVGAEGLVRGASRMALGLGISPTVTATNSGLALDGEYFGQLPTGDGVPGGEAVLPLRVLAANGDINGDGCTDDADLLAVLFAFGTQGARSEDANGDNLVDDADLLLVLFAFGSGC